MTSRLGTGKPLTFFYSVSWRDRERGGGGGEERDREESNLKFYPMLFAGFPHQNSWPGDVSRSLENSATNSRT